jgi:hypothetical protein
VLPLYCCAHIKCPSFVLLLKPEVSCHCTAASEPAPAPKAEPRGELDFLADGLTNPNPAAETSGAAANGNSGFEPGAFANGGHDPMMQQQHQQQQGMHPGYPGGYPGAYPGYEPQMTGYGMPHMGMGYQPQMTGYAPNPFMQDMNSMAIVPVGKLFSISMSPPPTRHSLQHQHGRVLACSCSGIS